MRKQNLFFALILTIVMTACHEPNKEWRQTGSISSYELSGPDGKDTVNLTHDGKKEGHWVVKKDIIPKASILPTDTKETLRNKIIRVTLEEGFYKDNKKEGTWKYYNEEDGSFRDSVVYKNGEVVK